MMPAWLVPLVTYGAPGVVVGWIAGCGFIVACCWRRLTRPSVAEETRRLRRELDEAHGRLRTLQAANDTLARQLASARTVIVRCPDVRARRSA